VQQGFLIRLMARVSNLPSGHSLVNLFGPTSVRADRTTRAGGIFLRLPDHVTLLARAAGRRPAMTFPKWRPIRVCGLVPEPRHLLEANHARL
jgi:hypothetical protein